MTDTTVLFFLMLAKKKQNVTIQNTNPIKNWEVFWQHVVFDVLDERFRVHKDKEDECPVEIPCALIHHINTENKKLLAIQLLHILSTDVQQNKGLYQGFMYLTGRDRHNLETESVTSLLIYIGSEHIGY